jgi:hypothetical protein
MRRRHPTCPGGGHGTSRRPCPDRWQLPSDSANDSPPRCSSISGVQMLAVHFVSIFKFGDSNGSNGQIVSIAVTQHRTQATRGTAHQHTLEQIIGRRDRIIPAGQGAPQMHQDAVRGSLQLTQPIRWAPGAIRWLMEELCCHRRNSCHRMTEDRSTNDSILFLRQLLKRNGCVKAIDGGLVASASDQIFMCCHA